jgi:DNA topoisomerase-1
VTTDASTEDTKASGTVRRLVIVESPAKARTIGQFLGSDYVVESSIGHIRDLPSSAAQIPKQYKKEKWARLGVNIEKNFEPLYVVPPDKTKQVTKLRKLLKDADELYLATDEDREGEAIAWHLLQVLKPKVPVKRMVFHEITREAIDEALAQPREVDAELVEAQETRRILDRLVGYEVSPVLWRKVKPRLSAGRVQSVAVRVIVERERQRMRFRSAGYWDVEAILRTRDGREETVLTKMIELDGKRLAVGRDFDPETGVLNDAAAVELLDATSAPAISSALESAAFTVTDVQERPYTQKAPAPFITSTLQQEAGRKLRYSAQRTMQVAQRLYENGYITYMRTDSVNLSEQAVSAARRQASEMYGAEYVPETPRKYASTTRGAQEAHEAVRPAGDIFRTPASLNRELDADALRLYELIWMRTVASQMKDANGVRTQVRLEAEAGDRGTATFQTSGKVITFPGFLRAYVEGSDDPDAALDDQERLLPPLQSGQQLDPNSTEAKGHETQPPSRWTEASLIRELEERGIGRPSTYASIIQTIQDRGYAWKKGSALVPTFIAFAVTRLLEEHFPDLVDYDFTAKMESSLDDIADGEREGRPWLHRFYFGDEDAPPDDSMAVEGLHGTISSGWEDIDARAVSSVALGEDAEGREVAVRVGRYGVYVQAGEEPLRADLPEDVEPDEVDLARAEELLHQESLGDQPLGADENTGELIYLKTGRFGPYVQLGEDPERDEKGKIPKDAPKPRRSSLWPDMAMETITIEEARELLTFPKNLGAHPETGIDIMVQDGPNGPYIKMETESRSLEGHEQMRNLTMLEAIAILAEPRKGRGANRSPQILHEVGKHPDSEASITVRNGRFGPYVTDGQVNASLPKGRDPKNIDLQAALDLIAAREERMRAEGKDPRAPKAKSGGRRTTKRRQKKSA